MKIKPKPMQNIFRTLLGVAFVTNTAGAFSGSAETQPKKLFGAAPVRPVGKFPDHVAVADFSGDGIQDLAVSDRAGVVHILIGQSDGSFLSPVFYPAGEICQGIVAEDFNRDGKLD